MPSLAKLSTPRLSNIYNRTRLFKKLDEALHNPVVWLSAPAGSGKTTLIASYFKENKIKPLWYQVDEGDADIASFFNYLGVLYKQEVSKSKKNLPLLTPEYLYGLPTFTRNYFREFFSNIKNPGVLVFDNFQDAGLDIPLHDLLQVIFEEIPAGLNIIVISRTDPVSSLSRLRVMNKIKILDWNDLRLKREESLSIAKIHNNVVEHEHSNTVVQQLHDYSQGWVSGLTLMLESPEIIKEEVSFSILAPEVLFEYFANEIFNKAARDAQEFLIKTAFLPYLTPSLVQDIVNYPDATGYLVDLYKRNYFIVSTDNSGKHFQYHALFHDFLKARAGTYFDKPTLKSIKDQSARILIDFDMPDEAIVLLKENESWDELIQLVLSQADNVVALGRYLTLRSWIENIPKPITDAQPWLLFWMGASYQPFDMIISRNYYEQAYRLFYKGNDATGAYLSWSSAIDTFLYVWADFNPLDIWIKRFEKLQHRFPEYPSKDIETRVISGMFAAVLWRRSERKELKIWTALAEGMIKQDDVAIHSKVILANNLLSYYIWWLGDIPESKRIISTINILTNHEELPPITQLMCKARESIFSSFTKPTEKCLLTVHEGLVISEDTGIYAFNFLLYSQAVYSCFSEGNLDKAKSYISNMSQYVMDGVYVDVAHYYYLNAWLAILENDVKTAAGYIDTIMDNSNRSGMPGMIYPAMILQADILFEQNKHTESKKIIDIVFKYASKNETQYKRLHCMLFYVRLCYASSQDEEALRWLNKALSLAKEQGYEKHSFMGWRRDVMSEIYAIALEENIETEYVCQNIIKRKLKPPVKHSCPTNWPFPIKITSLGTFKLVLNSELLIFKGKVQKKPIELLKAIIASGGKNVNAQRLAERLWPDTEGDAAYKALAITLKRARDLVQNKKALLLVEGELSLNPQYVWLDVWALEQAEQQHDENQLQQTLILYQGSFLEGDDASWAIHLRHKLQEKIVNLISRLGKLYHDKKKWKSSISVYQRGLQIDPLFEDFYKGLMYSYIKLSKNSEAVKTYMQCKEKLRENLNISPSTDIISLYNMICEAP